VASNNPSAVGHQGEAPWCDSDNTLGTAIKKKRKPRSRPRREDDRSGTEPGDVAARLGPYRVG
jgi:hypothetical protein